MRHLHRRRLTSCLLAGACALSVLPAAFGQAGMGTRTPPGRGGSDTAAEAPQAEEVRPPKPAPPKKPGRLLPYGILFVLGGIAIGVGLIPSKRTHQD